MALTLRVKTKDSQHVVKTLTAESTIEDLKNEILQISSLSTSSLKILQGYPPKPMDLRNSSVKLSAIPLRSGDTLLVEEDKVAKAEISNKKTEKILRELQSQYEAGAGILTRQIVPANNSCLFTSIHFVMENAVLDLNAATKMRQMIAEEVSKDLDTYNDAFLGKGNAEYCAWIKDENSWGGAIEISILSKHYNTEIDVVDTQSVRIDRFGEDQSYYRRALLLYDGIHYDPLMLESFDATIPPKTIFSTADEEILEMAKELASEAKSSKQFTDVAKFSLRCLICQQAIKGQSEAQDHAKTTGHINFGEY